MPMTKTEVRDLQHALNRFTSKRLVEVTPIIVDGVRGHSTGARVRLVKYYLGYKPENRTPRVDADFLRRLNHPFWKRGPASPKSIALGLHRRSKQRRVAKADKVALANKVGFAVFQGKTVAAWMVPWLEKSVRAGWHGYVTSGVRTPAYSEHLCYAMCGAPSCSGRCAGRSSNHNMLPDQGKPYGALDVTDYVNFGAIQRKIGSPLHNALGAADPVHFSVSGR